MNPTSYYSYNIHDINNEKKGQNIKDLWAIPAIMFTKFTIRIIEGIQSIDIVINERKTSTNMKREKNLHKGKSR